jgi:hypothetical protein
MSSLSLRKLLSCRVLQDRTSVGVPKSEVSARQRRGRYGAARSVLIFFAPPAVGGPQAWSPKQSGPAVSGRAIKALDDPAMERLDPIEQTSRCLAARSQSPRPGVLSNDSHDAVSVERLLLLSDGEPAALFTFIYFRRNGMQVLALRKRGCWRSNQRHISSGR